MSGQFVGVAPPHGPPHIPASLSPLPPSPSPEASQSGRQTPPTTCNHTLLDSVDSDPPAPCSEGEKEEGEEEEEGRVLDTGSASRDSGQSACLSQDSSNGGGKGPGVENVEEAENSCAAATESL